MPPLPTPPQAAPPPVPPRPANLMMTIGNAIENIQPMSPGHPVWEVTMKGGSKIVVKSESIATSYNTQGQHLAAMTPANVKAINGIMATVSPGHEQHPLTDAEITALAAFKAAPDDLAGYIQQARAKQQVLLKMKHDPGFRTLGKATELSLTDKDKAAFNDLILALLGNAPAWQSLGKIAIADAFIGNNDRLDLGNKMVGNAGNVIFHRAADGKVTHAKGLDTLDPSASDAAHMYGTNITDWSNTFGVHIRDKTQFPALAQAIIADFNRRNLTPLGITNLTPAEAGALAQGMVMGWDALAARIAGQVRAGNKVPSGVMARARYLGWV